MHAKRSCKKLTVGMLVFLLFFSSVGPVLAAETTYGVERSPVFSKLQTKYDPVTGAFTYEYPLNIPPGRNGMQPSLTLSYNNQNTDNQNLFGYGWSINIPYIETMNKQGVDKMYTEDNYYSSWTGELGVGSGGLGMALVENNQSPNTNNQEISNDQISITNTNTDSDILENLRLKTTKDKILEVEDIDWIVRKEDGSYENKGKIKKYLYISDKKVGQAIYKGLGEDISKRTLNTQFFRKPELNKDGNQEWIARVYGGTPFYKENNTWYQTETATTTLDAYETQVGKTLGQRAVEFLLVKAVNASQNNIYSSSSDGTVNNGDTGWSTTHDATTGDYAGPADSVVSAEVSYLGSSTYNVQRLCNQIDTSSLPDNANIALATMYMWNRAAGLDSDNGSEVDLVQCTPGSTDSLTLADFDQFGTTLGADSSVGLPVESGQYSSWFLNSTGKSWIDVGGYTQIGIVVNWDRDNTEPNGYNYYQTYMSEAAGTDNDPYLEISYTIPGVMSGTSYGSKIDSGEFLDYQLIDSDGLDYWQVIDKKGTINKFGYAEDTRQFDVASSTEIKKWMLEETRDTNDNYISYEYFKDGNQLYPSKIKYTGSGSTDGIYEIEFLREAREDNATTTDAGFEVGNNYRISEIQVKINGDWVRKYDLVYTTGDNGYRSVLSNITETGRDESSNTVSLPATNFNYSQKTPYTWTEDENYSVPYPFTDADDNDTGARLADVNGDGLIDILVAKQSGTSAVYINDGDGTGWTEDENYTIPVDFTNSSGTAYRYRQIFDVNGDGLDDILDSYNDDTYINDGDGTGWTLDTNYYIPFNLASTAVKIGDVNGDGLPDAVVKYNAASSYAYINDGDGTGWTQDTNYSTDRDFVDYQNKDQGARLADVNGDGLADLVYAKETGTKSVYINNGDGTGWTEDIDYTFPTLLANSQTGNDQGTRLVDVNGDGLIDVWRSTDLDSFGNKVYINKGDGTGWVYDSTYLNSINFTHGSLDNGARLADVDGNGLVDMVVFKENYGSSEEYVILNDGVKPDMMSYMCNDKGAEITVSYKGSPEYVDESDNLLNPNLPLLLQTVEEIGTNDGFGNIATTTFAYSLGDFYYSDPFDRKFAGFGKVYATDPWNDLTIDYYHQGNTSSSTIGEYLDDVSKIGKKYRTEVYDDSDNLYSKSINKWENVYLDDDRDFVKLTRTTEFSYDGDSDHKEKASEFVYDDSNGNLLGQINWGEVAGSDDGTFTDTGTDKASSTISYAASSTLYIIGLPKQEVLYDQNEDKVKETKYYYDNLSQGSVAKGNLTKTEFWKTGNTYIDLENTYNSYGLVTQTKDPRDKATNFTYDAHNLYVATSTNPLSQVTEYYYDYSNGKVKKLFDANDLEYQTVYDALDRVSQEKQPDIDTPSSLVTKTAYTYTDTIGSRSVLQTNYLDGSTDFTVYTYLDGLDRPIQTRKEAESSGIFSAKDFAYNGFGLVEKESLPYFSSGSSKTSATTSDVMFVRYDYDPLHRVTSVANVVGTTTNTYDDWKLTVTDALGNAKDTYMDAYGNLVQVDEHNDASTYTTEYEYDLLGNLATTTDALDNVRHFTYDGLSRRLTAEDLHTVSDTYFGTYSYTYDDSGNLTSKVDPNSQTVNFTYDDLNRVLTEDYTGSGGTETSYKYDVCAYGVGRLCSATTTDAVTSLDYNALGLVSQERKTLNSTDYDTVYDYDRQGNITSITYPDDTVVNYTYNTAGLLESVTDYVDDFDYNAMEQITFEDLSNGTETTNSYDQNELYRLKHKQTEVSGMGMAMAMFSVETPHQEYSESGKESTMRIALDGSSEPDGASNLHEEEQPSLLDTIIDTTKEILGINNHIPDNLKLKATKDKILEVEEVDWMVRLEDGSYENKGKIKKYLYVSDVEVGPQEYKGLSEDISKRTKNTQFFKQEGNAYLARVYSGHPFYQDGNKWYQTETATTSIEAYEQQTNPGLLSKLKIFILGNQALADDDIFYAGGGDGTCAQNNNSSGWDAAHDATNSTLTYYQQASGSETTVGKTGGGNTKIFRSYLPIDTSSLPDEVEISSATINIAEDNTQSLDNALNDGLDYLAIVESTQSSPTELASGDYSETDTVELSDEIDFGDITLNDYNTFTLNSSGIALIDATGYTQFALREGHDIQDSDPSGSSGQANAFRWAASEWAGTDYDPYLEITYTEANTGVFQDLTYSYDAVGNITQIVDASETDSYKTINFTYDDLYRLTRASTTAATTTDYLRTYEYNAIGNITNKSDQGAYLYQGDSGTSYANPHAVSSVNGVSYSYDNNGNLTSDSTWTHSWDYNNRLTQSGSASATTTYAYDHAGNRIKKTDDGTTSYYINSYYELVDGEVSKHIFAGSIKVASIKGTSTTIFHHNDHLSSSSVDTDSDGNILTVMDYFPFGDSRIDTEYGDYENDYKFTGKELDQSTDLYYYGARYYDANIGRFVSADPWGGSLVNPQSLNKYSYSFNNPVMYIDPNGETPAEAAEGYFDGLSQGAWNTIEFVSNFFWDPVESAKNVAEGVVEGAKAWQELGTDLVQNTGETIDQIQEGVGISINEFEALPDYEKGKAMGLVTEKIMEFTAAAKGLSETQAKGPSPKAGSSGGPNTGKNFSKSVQEQARLDSGNRCVFCGTRTNTLKESNPYKSEIDHAVPKSRGGNNSWSNAQNTCRTCNRQKGSMTTGEYLNSNNN